MTKPDDPARADARARLAYLDECTDLLWPGTGIREHVVLPGPSRPRLLVPARPRRAGVQSLVRYTAQQSRRDQVKSLAVAGAFAAGLMRTSAPARATTGSTSTGETIDDALTRLLGRAVTTSLALTHPRPNRKPVLQVFDRRGATIAFAKVGVTALARRLVDAEAAALAQLAAVRPGALRAPEVLAHEQWGATSLLVTSALPLGRPVMAAEVAGRLGHAMRAVSEIGPADAMPAYLDALRRRATELDDADDYVAVLDRLAGDDAVAQLATGSWHGDWTGWNCARPRRRGAPLVVWDWERFTAPAPRGYDALHFVLNDRVTTGRADWATAAAELVDAAPRLLTAWSMPATHARRVAALYVLDLAVRYRTDDTVHDVDQWALPLVGSVLSTDQRGAAT